MFWSLRKKWALLALAVITVVGGGLRFYGLGIQSLWSDELASWYFSRSGGVLQVVQHVRHDVHPPGYFVMLRFSQELLGSSERALRLPSAVAGVLGIPAIYLLGRRIYSEREGVISALLLAVSWAAIYYSQETRSYSILILLSVLTAFFWWGIMRGLRGERRLPTGEAVGYVLAAVCCAYAHYFGALLVALQGAALAVLAYRSLPKVVLLYVPVALAYVPWLPGMAYQMRYSKQFGAWIGPPTLDTFVGYAEFLFGRSVPITLAACALLAPLGFRAAHFFQERREKAATFPAGFPAGLLLAAWLVGPFVAGYALSRLSVNMVTDKNLLVSLPAAYLLLSRAITGVLPGRPAGALVQWSLALGLAAVCLANLFFSLHYYTSYNKEQIRAAASYIHDHEGPKALVVRCDVDARTDYYLDGGGHGGTPVVNACTAADFPRLMEKVRSGGYDQVFYLMSHKQPTPQLVSKLRTNFRLVAYRPFYRTWVAEFGVGKKAEAPRG